jgi:hypothetical protein
VLKPKEHDIEKFYARTCPDVSNEGTDTGPLGRKYHVTAGHFNEIQQVSITIYDVQN